MSAVFGERFVHDVIVRLRHWIHISVVEPHVHVKQDRFCGFAILGRVETM